MKQRTSNWAGIISHLLGLVLILATAGWAQTGSDPAIPAHRARSVEDWSSLSLAGSQLHIEKPVFGEKDNFPQFTRELIQVQWRLGDPIDLYVIRPKGVARPSVVLYLYSYPSETDRFRNNDYCGRLTRDGVAAVGFVSALTGHRYSNRPMREWFVSELQEALGSSVHDVQMILNFLSTRDDLDMSKVGMLGGGSGGTIAILAAAADPRIKAIDVLDPWGDWPEWVAKSSLIPDEERKRYTQPEFLKKVEPLDPVKWLPQLKSKRVRLQQLADDMVTPNAAKEKIETAAGPAATVVHYDSTRQLFMAIPGDTLFRWIKEQVKPQSQRPTAALKADAKSSQ
jgi:hypothetical protein